MFPHFLRRSELSFNWSSWEPVHFMHNEIGSVHNFQNVFTTSSALRLSSGKSNTKGTCSAWLWRGPLAREEKRLLAKHGANWVYAAEANSRHGHHQIRHTAAISFLSINTTKPTVELLSGRNDNITSLRATRDQSPSYAFRSPWLHIFIGTQPRSIGTRNNDDPRLQHANWKANVFFYLSQTQTHSPQSPPSVMLCK